MIESQIMAALGPIFETVFDRTDIVLTSELSARDVDGWDSLKQVEILMLVEERLGARLTSRQIDGLNNVGDLVKAIAESLSKR